ncbi:MAG: hypothetical protein GXY87_06225 [Tissierellia bacterium]|nr:hypothetical protein [Tissierellia bacterium]
MLNEYNYYKELPYTEKVPGKYQDWNIQFKDKDGNDQVWKISNLAQRLNNKKRLIFSPNYLSSKKALGFELMELTWHVTGEEVRQKVLNEVMTKKQADVFDVQISYSGGNPPTSLYGKIWEQDWFNINKVTAKDYLETDLFDFFIDIKTYDYRLAKLSETEQQEIRDSLDEIINKITDIYGPNTSYRIFIDQENQIRKD